MDATELLSRIPLSARTVLHFGCVDGTLVSAYRKHNPRARVLGLVLDGEAARPDQSCFDEVSTFDPLAAPLPFDLPDGLDCIVYDGALERLDEPWTLVRAHAAALGAEGMMLIRMRNSGHWGLVDALLRGVPEPPGTPIGFDGDAAMRQLRQAGLHLCDVAASPDDAEQATRFVETVAPALLALGIDPQAYRARCKGSHLIWRMRKRPRARLLVSGSMLAPIGGVSHVRVVHPLNALASDPSVSAKVTNRVEPDPGGGAPRIFVLHRPALVGDEGQRILRALHDAGYLIVTEFDDHPDHFEMMRKGGALTFTGVHAVQTSTPKLAEALRRYNPEVAVFPNAVVSLPEVTNFADPDRLTLFFGALNREKDWVSLMPIVNEVAALAAGRLRFEVVHDNEFFDALDTPHKRFTPTCDYPTYQRLLGGAEICFMPLSDTVFNRSKSDLKFIEAASFRVASLASDVVYADSIADNETGLVFRDPEEFRMALMRLVALPELARRLADAARAHVAAERMMAYQVAERIRWYRSLWERRETLEQARRSRLASHAAGLAA